MRTKLYAFMAIAISLLAVFSVAGLVSAGSTNGTSNVTAVMGNAHGAVYTIDNAAALNSVIMYEDLPTANWCVSERSRPMVQALGQHLQVRVLSC